MLYKNLDWKKKKKKKKIMLLDCFKEINLHLGKNETANNLYSLTPPLKKLTKNNTTLIKHNRHFLQTF